MGVLFPQCSLQSGENSFLFNEEIDSNECIFQDYDIVYRGVVAIANMIEAGKDVADKMMDTKVLDVCQALIIKANMDSSNFEPIPELAKIKSVAEVALNKAHAMGVIKTYEQAVKEDEDDEELEEWRHHPKAAITDVTDESSS